jgi:nicotinate dehydrogenase subunit A
MITLTVNGQQHQLDADPATPLLYVLRGELELNGAKFGCGLGQCGACTVIVDGEAVFSCLTPVMALQGRKVTTVEGLGNDHACTSPAREKFCPLGCADPGADGAESVSLRNPYAHTARDPPRQRCDALG